MGGTYGGRGVALTPTRTLTLTLTLTLTPTGKYTYSDGGYYEGEFVATLSHYKHGVHFPNPNGLRHGRGVRVYANGNRYEGPFREGKSVGV